MDDLREKTIFNYHEVFANQLSSAITNKATGREKPAKETLILISEYCYALNNSDLTEEEITKYIESLRKMTFDKLIFEATKQMKIAKLTPQQTFQFSGTYRSRVKQYFNKYFKG